MTSIFTIRKFVSLLLVGFIFFFVIKSPVEAGTIFRNVIQSLSHVFVNSANAFSEFLKTVF